MLLDSTTLRLAREGLLLDTVQQHANAAVRFAVESA